MTNENDDCFSIDSPDIGLHESISLTKIQTDLLPCILPCDGLCCDYTFTSVVLFVAFSDANSLFLDNTK